MRVPPLLQELQRLTKQRGGPLVIAHRGGAAIAPENTLFAFEQAASIHRVDMIELDVHATVDGVLVVAHDDDVDRCTDGHGAIALMRHDEIDALDAAFRFTTDGTTTALRGRGIRIPKLRDVFDTLPNMLFNLELKPSARRAIDRLASMLRAADAIERVCIGSEDDDVATLLHRALPEACHFYARDALTTLVMALKSGSEPHIDERFHVLDMPLCFGDVRLVDRAFVDAAESIGRFVNVWTIDDEAEMRRLCDDGVGGVMTDRPDRLAHVVATHRAESSTRNDR